MGSLETLEVTVSTEMDRAELGPRPASWLDAETFWRSVSGDGYHVTLAASIGRDAWPGVVEFASPHLETLSVVDAPAFFGEWRRVTGRS